MAKTSSSSSVVKFSISEALQHGWELFKERWVFWIGITVLVFVFNLLPGFINGMVGRDADGLRALISFVGWIFNLIVNMGWIYVSLRAVRGEEATWGNLFDKASLFFKYLVGMLLYMVIVVGGFILLIIPGVIWAIKFVFTPYLIVDKGMGPIEALKASAQLTKGAKWDLFALSIVFAVVNFLGMLVLLVGLLVTSPVTLLAQSYVYDKLLAKLRTT